MVANKAGSRTATWFCIKNLSAVESVEAVVSSGLLVKGKERIVLAGDLFPDIPFSVVKRHLHWLVVE